MRGPVLVPVLGDQLTPNLSSLDGLAPGETVIVMAEVMAEATYVRHHKAKIALVFSAMRHFAEEMCAKGWTVDYQPLDAFWIRRGYRHHPELHTRYHWRDLDETEESAKPMSFWLKELAP